MPTNSDGVRLQQKPDADGTKTVGQPVWVHSGMKKQASLSVGAAVEVAVAEMSDAVAPTSRSSREGRAASDPALELIEEIYREQAGRFRRVAAAIVESAE